MTLSKPALISRNRVETFNLGLWRVFISCMSVRQVSAGLSPGRKPHWFGWRRPLDLTMADNLTVITCSRILEMLVRRMMMRKGGRGVVGVLARLLQDNSFGGFQGWGVVSEQHQGGEEFEDDGRVDVVYTFSTRSRGPRRGLGRRRGSSWRGRT